MKACIICSNDVEGKPAAKVKDDRIIGTIRAIKQKLGFAKNNELYVCETDLPKHAERRKSFERNLLISIILAGLLFILFIYSSIVSGTLNLWAFVSGLIIVVFILSLPLITYTPAIEPFEPTKVDNNGK